MDIYRERRRERSVVECAEIAVIQEWLEGVDWIGSEIVVDYCLNFVSAVVTGQLAWRGDWGARDWMIGLPAGRLALSTTPLTEFFREPPCSDWLRACPGSTGHSGRLNYLGGWTRWVRRGIGAAPSSRLTKTNGGKRARRGGSGTVRTLLRPRGSLVHTSSAWSVSASRSGQGMGCSYVRFSSDSSDAGVPRHQLLHWLVRRVRDFRRVLHAQDK